jgi:fatty acid desaturase
MQQLNSEIVGTPGALPRDWDARASVARAMAVNHTQRTLQMLFETLMVSLVLYLADLWVIAHAASWIHWPLAAAQGFWIQRCYCVGHEAAHGKLLPGRPLTNDILGQLALFALLTPLPIFRKIHRFHHGHNRRDWTTSALEVSVLERDSQWGRFTAWCRWLLAVFAAGWFWHGLLSILLFLCLPVARAQSISPAFRGWTLRERGLSWLGFALGLSIHWGVGLTLGFQRWLQWLGTPLLFFAWIYSAQLYIYHYGTPVGPEVTRHARSLGGRLVGWWLLNLNEHATHHLRPAIVWYALRTAARQTGAELNRSWLWGIANQLRGPRIVIRTEKA